MYPCGGIGLIVSCVTRQAAYILEEELFSFSERVGILSPPSLLRGLEEDRRLVEECPTLVIDGCAHQCGSNLLRLLGIWPAARIYLPEIMVATGLQPGRTRKELEEPGKRLAHATARLAAAIIEEILSDPRYVFARQAIQSEGQTLFDYSVDVEKEMGYIQVARGLFRPAKMPPFRLPSAVPPLSR